MAKSAPLSKWAILAVVLAVGFVSAVFLKYGPYILLSDASLLGTIEVCGLLISTMVLAEYGRRRELRTTSVVVGLSCLLCLLPIYWLSLVSETRGVSLVLTVYDTLFCFLLLVYYAAEKPLPGATAAAPTRTEECLSSSIHISVFQERPTAIGYYKYVMPQVGFEFANIGKLPITARVNVAVYLGVQSVGGVSGDKHGYYRGEMPWERDPGTIFYGNFTLPARCVDSKETLRIQVDVSIADAHNKESKIVRCFTYAREANNWFPEATTYVNLKKGAEEKGYRL